MTQHDLEKLLEDTADDILEKVAEREHKSLRQLGMINRRRERTVREREIPFSSAFTRRRRERG